MMCPYCDSDKLYVIYSEGHMEFENKRYPLKHESTKCIKCEKEFFTKENTKKNHEYLRECTSASAPVQLRPN